MAPLHPPIFCTLLLYLTSSQISWLLTYCHLCTSRHGHGHGRNLIPSHVPARLRPTRTTGGLTSPARLRLITPTGSLHGPGPAVSCPRQGRPLYTNRPPSTGTALVMGPSPAQADPDPKTSLSRPSGVDLELVTVLTQITPHLSPKCQSLQRPGGTLSRRQVPVPASPTMLHLDTTTSASSPVEGTLCEIFDTTTSASSSVEGAWCESHTMAPDVCILNPSNGTHNCRPGWRTCWVRLPSAAYRSTHTLAYEPSRAAPMKAQVPKIIPLLDM